MDSRESENTISLDTCSIVPLELPYFKVDHPSGRHHYPCGKRWGLARVCKQDKAKKDRGAVTQIESSTACFNICPAIGL